jgi:hypothetical protein
MMKLNDVDNDKVRMAKVAKRLRESYGIDATKFSGASRKKIQEKIRIIENRSGFSKQHKNPEWKRLALVLEYIKLREGKGQIGPSKGDLAHEKMFKKMDQSGNMNGFKAPDKKDVEDRYSKMADKHGVKEARTHLRNLMESDLERVEIVMASRNIVDEIQDMVESISKTRVEKLSPLVDRIKAEFGLSQAENFNSTVSDQLDKALDSLMSVKDSIDTESLKLSGDVDPAAVSDFDDEDESDLDPGDDDFDSDDDIDIGDDTDDDMDLGEPEPLDRQLKESVVIQLETVNGKKGTKTFESKKKMRKWLNENQSKIAKILTVR